MSLLNVSTLSKTFVTQRSLFGRARGDIHAVSNVSFDIEEGETVALVGESGSGKSTTARLILRLIEPDEGRVVFDGTDVRSLSKATLRHFRKKMQIIFQDPHGSFDPRVTVGESIAEPLLVHFHISRKERLSIAAELLERVGMSVQDLGRMPRELSGGQLQRAAIARALTLKPLLLVCDESVSALDVSIRAQVLNLMTRLQKDLKVSYLFITHDLSVVRAFANRVNVMSKGEIVESGPTEMIFNSPEHEYTRQLLSAVPTLLPRARRHGADQYREVAAPTAGRTSSELL